MSKAIKTVNGLDVISNNESLLLQPVNTDLLQQQTICTFHPCIYTKPCSIISDSNITEHQIYLDHFDSAPDEWRDV